MEVDIPDLDDVAFEVTCCSCYGRPKAVPCPRCNDVGVCVTPVGERLITFLRTHYSLTPVK